MAKSDQPIQIDQRVFLPPGNMFRTYAPEKRAVIRADAVGELTFKTAWDYEEERRQRRQQHH